ncbi:hypothetical protein SPPR111872_22335 [Sphingobacterium prati]
MMSCYKNYQSQFILYQVCYFNKFLTLFTIINDLKSCVYFFYVRYKTACFK